MDESKLEVYSLRRGFRIGEAWNDGQIPKDLEDEAGVRICILTLSPLMEER